LITVFSATALLCQSASDHTLRDPGWPREFDRNGTKLIVYQPQIENWEKFRVLKADTAVSITQSGHKPVLGVFSWQANTVPNLISRTVTINDIHVISARFPSLDPAAAAAMQAKAMQVYPTKVMVISLDRMLAGFRAEEMKSTPPLNTTPPPIYVSMSPAILLFVDGSPVRVPIQQTGIEYVVNTTWDLFYNDSNYYLLNGTTWLTARTLEGPWTGTTKLPANMAKVPSGDNWQDVKKALPPKAPIGPATKVIFTSKPAELLVFRGKPAFSPVPRTALAYATNTTSNVFQYSVNRQFYVLVSGRWFSAPSLDGPWTYAGAGLPEDFRNIPSNSVAGSVLASVPGTQEAHDAVLLAQIPTVAVVNKQEAEAKVKVQYTGPPKFVPITNMSLSYAVNTNDRVIQVGDLYYLCFQGVWFMSTTPNGPWKAADSVPPVIYTIPPSSPVYNVTYVTVSDPTPTTVVTSYTAGYTGIFLMGFAMGTTVVYGTGYYYPPYFYPGFYPYPVYYPYPYTYGVGAVYHPYTGAYSYSQVVYGPYASAGSTAWYNPTTGAYGRAVTYQNAYGGSTYAQAYNPWTGTYAATQQHNNTYSQWGSSVVSTPYQTVNMQHYANANGAAGSYQTSKGGSGAGVVGPGGQTYYHGTTDSGTQYAGKDGNVYKQNPDGNWSEYSNGSWTPVNTTQAQQQVQQRGQNSSASQDLSKSSSTLQTKNGGSASTTTVSNSKGASGTAVTGPGGETGYVAKGANNNVYAGQDGNVYKQDSSGQWSKYDNGTWNQVTTPSNQRPTQSGANSTANSQQRQSSLSNSGTSGRGANVSPDTYQQLNNDANARRQGSSRASGSSRGSWGGTRRR
jgi:hypothetical protein